MGPGLALALRGAWWGRGAEALGEGDEGGEGAAEHARDGAQEAAGLRGGGEDFVRARAVEEVLELAHVGDDFPAAGFEEPGPVGGELVARGLGRGGVGAGLFGGRRCACRPGSLGGGADCACGQFGHQAGEALAGAVDVAPEGGDVEDEGGFAAQQAGDCGAQIGQNRGDM